MRSGGELWHIYRRNNVYSPGFEFPPAKQKIAREYCSEFVRRLPSFFRCLFALLACAALPAALPAAAQETSAAQGYSVRGTVVNAVSGQAVGRALVSFDFEHTVLTAGDGSFAFDDLPPGNYGVSVLKPGFQGFGDMRSGMMVRGINGGRNFENIPARRVVVGPDMPALTFRITPLAMIAGHVALSTADPADGILVQVYGRQMRNGRAQWGLDGTARTRSDGSFRVPNLEPGHYMISTMPSVDRPAPQGAAVWGFPAMYYPGVADVAAAGVITLAAGQQAEADFTLVRQPFFPVIAVVHSNSDTQANFEVLDSSGRPAGLPMNFDRREGVARASLPNGNWTIEAHSYGKAMQWGSTNFQVNSAPVSLAISIVPVPNILVNIHRDFVTSTNNGVQAEVGVFMVDGGDAQQDSGPGMNLQLVPADENNFEAGVGGGMNQAEGDSRQWQITVNQPGRYWVEAQPFAPAYIASITAGGVDLGSNPLTVMPASTPPIVDVTLRNDPGTITGEVVNQMANAAPGAVAVGVRPQVWIYAIPLFSTAAHLPEGSMEPNGSFSISDLAPGSYRVVACDTPQEIDFHTAEGLAGWAGRGQTVTVEAGGTASVQLDVVHVEAAP